MSLLLNLNGVIIMNNLCMLFVIVNSTDESKVLKFINQYKLMAKVVMHGVGTASSSLLEYFGIDADYKTIFTSVLPPIICKNIMKDMKLKFKLDEPGMGIAFSIPLSSSTKYILDFYKDYEMEDIDMEVANQHLIITITNEGYADKVMNEAKKAGASGGTTLSGRGLESEKAIKFLNIAIEPEKDIVLILAPTDKKNDIMNTIVQNCGLKSPGAGICFSLPVDYAVGLHDFSKDNK